VIETEPSFESMHEEFGFEADFDINAAFQDALFGVATDEELALDEKVQRMEFILSEGTSDIYRDFVDFRAMAAQMNAACNHDHSLGSAVKGNEMLSSFMDAALKPEGAGHDHDHEHHQHDDDDDEDEHPHKKRQKARRR
jgi:hypothetical protein